MAVNIGPKIGVDGEREYRNQINQIIQQSKTLESQMKLVASSFTTATTAEERNAKTSSVLSKQIDVQRERVKLLAEQTGKAAAKYGESNAKTQKWQQALNEAQAVLNKMQGDLRATTADLRSMDDEMDDGSRKALSFGDVLKANLASDVIVSGIKAMASAIKEAGAALVDLGTGTAVCQRGLQDCRPERKPVHGDRHQLLRVSAPVHGRRHAGGGRESEPCHHGYVRQRQQDGHGHDQHPECLPGFCKAKLYHAG